jgi:hypothetical protein
VNEELVVPTCDGAVGEAIVIAGELHGVASRLAVSQEEAAYHEIFAVDHDRGFAGQDDLPCRRRTEGDRFARRAPGAEDDGLARPDAILHHERVARLGAHGGIGNVRRRSDLVLGAARRIQCQCTDKHERDSDGTSVVHG